MKLKIALIVVGTLLFFEGFTRFWVVSPAVIAYDPVLGPMKAPFSHILRTYEGYTSYIADGYGMNNDGLPSYMPKQRLLVLGDSFVEAEQVLREQNFVAKLNALPDTLAYNAGYSGADPRSFPVLAQRFSNIIQPTQLMLVINADDLTALSADHLPPYMQPTGIKAWLQPLFAHSALATHLNWKYKPVFQAWWQKWAQVDAPKTRVKVSYDDSIYAKHWATILRQLSVYHTPILLVALPKLHYKDGKAQAVHDERLETMIRVAERQGVQALRLEDILTQDFASTGQVAFGFMNSHLGTGHLNAHGHAMVAQAVEQALGLRP